MSAAARPSAPRRNGNGAHDGLKWGMVIAQILLLPLLGGMWITLADLKGEVAVIKNDVVWMKATFTDLQRRVHDLEHGKETK